MRSINGVRHQTGTAFFSSRSGFSLACEVAQTVVLPANGHGGRPLSSRLIPGYPTMSRKGICVGASILAIASLGDSAQVGASIVQAVTVNMIALHPITGGEFEQSTVQVDSRMDTVDVLVAGGVPALEKRPAPLANERDIYGVDGCISSDMAIAGVQRDSCRQAIAAQDGYGRWRRGTSPGTVARYCGAVWLNGESSTASLTGTLYRHLDLLLDRGARRRSVVSRSALCRANYTRSLRVRAILEAQSRSAT